MEVACFLQRPRRQCEPEDILLSDLQEPRLRLAVFLCRLLIFVTILAFVQYNDFILCIFENFQHTLRRAEKPQFLAT